MGCSPQSLAGWLTPPGSLPPTPPAYSPLSPVTSEPDHSMMFGFPGGFVPRHTVMPSPHHQRPQPLEDQQQQMPQVVASDNGSYSPLSTVNLLMDRRWGVGPTQNTGVNPMKQDVRQALLQQVAAGED